MEPTQRMVHARGVLAVALTLLALALVVPARASHAAVLGPWDIESLFFVSKSENHNQVHYGLRLHQDCTPAGPTPVFAYWKMLAERPGLTSALLDREQPAYGLGAQRVFHTGGQPRVKFHVRGFADRVIVARPRRSDGRCVAEVVCDIRGEPAVLKQIHVVLGMLWSVRSVTLEGHRLDSSHPTFEVLR